jgi:hypothetical protein
VEPIMPMIRISRSLEPLSIEHQRVAYLKTTRGHLAPNFSHDTLKGKKDTKTSKKEITEAHAGGLASSMNEFISPTVWSISANTTLHTRNAIRCP